MTVLPYTVMGQLGSCAAAFQNDNRHRGKTEAFSFHAGQSIVWIRNPRDCFAWLSALHGQGVSAVRHCPAAGQRGFRSGLLTVRADSGVRLERRAAEAARASVFRGRSRRRSGYVLRADVPYGVLQARFPESRSDNALIKSESGKNTFDGFGVNAGEEIARDVHFADAASRDAFPECLRQNARCGSCCRQDFCRTWLPRNRNACFRVLLYAPDRCQ